jgi:hypothetical protein
MEQSRPLTVDDAQRLQYEGMLEPYTVSANAARRACAMETISGDPRAEIVNDALGYKPRDTVDPAAAEAAKANAKVLPADEVARRDFARNAAANARPTPYQQKMEWDRYGLVGR